jgi:hypothetical protein
MKRKTLRLDDFTCCQTADVCLGGSGVQPFLGLRESCGFGKFGGKSGKTLEFRVIHLEISREKFTGNSKETQVSDFTCRKKRQRL